MEQLHIVGTFGAMLNQTLEETKGDGKELLC